MSSKRRDLKEKLRQCKGNTDIYNNWDPTVYYFGGELLLPYLLAQLHLYDIRKYAIDTFKPYKSRWHVLRDLLITPYYGFKNILTGIIKAVLLPFYLIAVGIMAVDHIATNRDSDRLTTLKDIGMVLGGAFFDVLAQTLHGCVQVATVPLNWFVRVPIRALITKVNGWRSFRSSDSLKIVANALDKMNRQQISPFDNANLPTTLYLLARLEEKLDKANNFSSPVCVEFRKINGPLFERINTQMEYSSLSCTSWRNLLRSYQFTNRYHPSSHVSMPPMPEDNKAIYNMISLVNKP